MRKLVLVKILHTFIWAIMVAAILCIVYAGVSGDIGIVTYAAIGLMTFEGLALLMGKGSCPLTPIARQFSDSPKANFDIYLPEWLARHNKLIFSVILAVGLALVVWRIWFS